MTAPDYEPVKLVASLATALITLASALLVLSMSSSRAASCGRKVGWVLLTLSIAAGALTLMTAIGCVRNGDVSRALEKPWVWVPAATQSVVLAIGMLVLVVTYWRSDGALVATMAAQVKAASEGLVTAAETADQERLKTEAELRVCRKERDESTRQAAEAETSVTRLTSDLTGATAEAQRLETENAQLRARVAELEAATQSED